MAIADYQASVDLTPNQPKVYNSLAVCYARLGYPNEALSYITKTIDTNLNNAYAKAYSNRGNIYDMMGRPAKAYENWKRGIDLGYTGSMNRYNANCP